MSDNLKRLVDWERKAEPYIDGALDRLRASTYTGRVLFGLAIVVLLVAVAKCGG